MPKERLTSLDGLKGIAILAVIFQHIPMGNFGYPSIIFNMGGVGVTIFFIITGFLMGYLYPEPGSYFNFIKKRYSRLFPPFLVMVASFAIFQLVHLAPIFQIGTVIALGVIMKYLLERNLNIPIKFILFFQALVALWYVFYLLHIPSAIFYQIWPKNIQLIISTLINATLTLPFGQYIPQFDGIYWALAAEVFFYLLYPVLYAPLITFAFKLSKIKKFLIILSLFPFCFGLNLIGQRFLGFETLKLYLVIYFIAGIVLSKLVKYQRFSKNPLWFPIFFFTVFFSVALNDFIPQYYKPWFPILLVIPTFFLLLTILDQTSVGSKILKHPWLHILGKYSYALFLSHSLVIHIVETYVKSTSPITALLVVVLTLSGSLILAWMLSQLTEKTYFSASKNTLQKCLNVVYQPRKVIVVFAIFILIITYFTFKPPLAFFTVAVNHLGTKQITQITKDKPVFQKFTADNNQLGMVLSHIKNQAILGLAAGPDLPKLLIKMYDQKNDVVAQSSYNVEEIIDSYYHPLGFPLQSTSKNNNYTVSYELTGLNRAQKTYLDTTEFNLLAVYFVNKIELLTQPLKLFDFAINKFMEPIRNPSFWLVSFYLLPFLGIFIVSTKVKN